MTAIGTAAPVAAESFARVDELSGYLWGVRSFISRVRVVVEMPAPPVALQKALDAYALMR